ncbi:DUF2703 domain-containing protein [Salinigranum sp. GCM10025319]|uniref:DUF2703 domain-containing protein n=1 Tax=Salinigranum sp. GCM10025319 TaxID=3252687 RepID=UPI00360AA0CC
MTTSSRETEPTYPRDVTVEFLYLDRDACERCRKTEAAVEAALSTVRPALALTNSRVVLDHRHVDSAATARAVDLAVSPTVRVDGRDVQPDIETADCGCGGATTIPCRVWRYRGRTHDAAPPGLFADAVLRAAYGRVPSESTVNADRREVPADAYFADGDLDAREGKPDHEPDRADHDRCC